MTDVVFYALVGVRWLHFVSIVAVTGGAVFWLWVARPWLATLRASVARTRALVRGAAVLAAVTGVGWLAMTIADMTGGLDSLADLETLHAFFFETPFGPVEIVRLALLAALVATSGRSFAIAASIGAMLLVSQAWLGHAAEGGQTLAGAAMILTYAVHVLAGAFWVGGLPPLALATGEARTPPSELLSRYSAMAIIAVALIIVSGVVNTGVHAGGDLGALVSSSYGKVLAMKLGLVAIMLALAAYNRFVAMPRLARGVPADGLSKAIAVEMAVGAAVLGAAALLGVTPPPV